MASSRIPTTNINYDVDTDENDIEGSELSLIKTGDRNPGRGGHGWGWGKITSKMWRDFDLVYKYDVEGNLIVHRIWKKYKNSYNVTSSDGTNHMRIYILKFSN